MSSSSNNPPPYGTDTFIHIFPNDGKGQVFSDDPFFKLVEETRQLFLSNSDILQYMARSTFVGEPTPESQLAREGNIRDFLQYNCPVVVGRKLPATSSTGGGHIHDSPNVAEKVMGREHVYIDQGTVSLCGYLPFIHDLDGTLAMPCSLLSFLFKLILLREFTIAAWSIYGTNKPAPGSEDIRSSTPFSPHPDVWVSGCGHVFVSYRRGKSRDLQSVVFLNDEGGYIDIPAVDTPSLRKIASGDWSVFQRDIITSIGPYRKANKKGYLERVWVATCGCTGLGGGRVAI